MYGESGIAARARRAVRLEPSAMAMWSTLSGTFGGASRWPALACVYLTMPGSCPLLNRTPRLHSLGCRVGDTIHGAARSPVRRRSSLGGRRASASNSSGGGASRYPPRALRVEIQTDCYGWASVKGASSGGVDIGSVWASVAGGVSLSSAVHCL